MATKHTAQQIIRALRRSKGQVYLAADILGCSAVTMYNWINKSETVKAALEEERGKLIDTAVVGLYSRVIDKEEWAIKYTLDRLGKDRGFGPEETRHHVTMQLDEELRSARSRITDSLTKTRERLANGQHNGAPEKHIEHTP